MNLISSDGTTETAYTRENMRAIAITQGNMLTKSPRYPVMIILTGKNIALMASVAANVGENISFMLLIAASLRLYPCLSFRI